LGYSTAKFNKERSGGIHAFNPTMNKEYKTYGLQGRKEGLHKRSPWGERERDR